MNDQKQEEQVGWLHNGLVKVFGRSYRTTIGGILGCVCGVVYVVAKVIPDPRLQVASEVCVALGMCGVGVVGWNAKDKKTTGAQ